MSTSEKQEQYDKTGRRYSPNTRHEKRRKSKHGKRPEVEKVDRGGPDYRGRRPYARLSPTNTQALVDRVDFREWDDEELARGRRRDKNGTFRGRDPKLVPSGAGKELARRKTIEANQYIAEQAPKLAEALVGIALDDLMDEKARVSAIKEAFEHILPKASANNVNITMEVKPWEEALKGAVVVVDNDDGGDAQPALTGGDTEGEDIVDAEVLDEEDAEPGDFDEPEDEPEPEPDGDDGDYDPIIE